MLDNYFKGRTASEHKYYVENRHGKHLTETDVELISIEKYSAEIKIKLDGIVFIYKCEFHFPFGISENNDFFQISCHKNIVKRLDKDSGPSKHQLNIMKYVAATAFQEKFYPKYHINLVD